MASLKIKPRRKAHQLDGGSGGNGILRLPVEILRHIVFFLPVGDAVSLSASSKTWRNVWTSLPVLNLNFDHDDDVVTLDDFVASIDNVLSTLRSRSAIIEGFSLTMNPYKEEGSKLESKLESHLDDWLSLVMKNYIKEINLRVSDSSDNVFYTLPQSVFTLKSLVKLQLIGCKFPPNISFADHDNDKKSRFHEFNCLREITLEDVIARDDQIQDIVDHARDFLEKLTIKTHPPLKFLSLEFFSKLDFIEVNVKTLLLNHAMNLDTVILYGIRRVYAFGVWNIKTLRFLTWDTSAYTSIKTFISSLPLVETIQLFMDHNENIQIQSSHLQTLFLYEGQRFEEPIVVEIEAPKLSKVHFTGFSFPMITLLRRTQKVELHHFGHPLGGIDSSQLYRLGKFSRNVMQPMIEVHLHRIFIENPLSLQELKEHAVGYHPTNVTMVVLECIPPTSDYSYFLDALFWTCHPTRLMILMNKEETIKSPHKAGFIRYLVDELVKRETNPTCCVERNRPKCWRHYIADVKLELYRSSREFDEEELTDIPVEMAENGTFSIVETTNKGIVVQFRLLWLGFPV
ncbi:uncharacterized protein LOC129289329 [Prosopis cineraria]|uniref:uncharacterized protein LOC129289329 n=1 Tax=Prosopis cineraria TaxID=364024 RepID=UPI00240F8C05|nr:uncharacterized protein LOC129289329 [Prosopis cineraria]